MLLTLFKKPIGRIVMAAHTAHRRVLGSFSH
jgi:hypothetical protein